MLLWLPDENPPEINAEDEERLKIWIARALVMLGLAVVLSALGFFWGSTQ